MRMMLAFVFIFSSISNTQTTTPTSPSSASSDVNQKSSSVTIPVGFGDVKRVVIEDIFEEEIENEDRRTLNEVNSFNMHDEVQTLYLEQIQSKINDFEDLKTQIAVLDRHLRKHSNFDDFESTDHILTELDGKIIKPYEDGLKAARNKMIKSSHEINAADSIRMVNTVVDNADVFLETGRVMVESALDAHLASDEHKNEHAHGDEDGHSEDHMSDYDDLISVESGVSIEDKEVLLEYIDMDINEFENIKKRKANYERHILEHVNQDNHEESEELNLAVDVLQDMNMEDMISYESSLKDLKAKIKETDGRLNVDSFQQISTTMKKADVYLEASRDKLELVGMLDEEFEENSQNHNFNINNDDGHFENEVMPAGRYSIGVDTNPTHQYGNHVKDALKNAAEDSHRFLHEKNVAHHVHVEKEEVPPIVFLPLNFSVAFTIITIVLIIGVMAAYLSRVIKTKIKSNDGDEDFDGSVSDAAHHGYSIVNKNFNATKLEGVKEHDGWTAKKWATPSGQTGRKRR